MEGKKKKIQRQRSAPLSPLRQWINLSGDDDDFDEEDDFFRGVFAEIFSTCLPKPWRRQIQILLYFPPFALARLWRALLLGIYLLPYIYIVHYIFIICNFLIYLSLGFGIWDLAYATNEALTIWKIPLDIQVRTLNTYPTGNGLIVKEIQYTCSTYKGRPVRIFGYFCYPTNQSSLPAIVIVHGGGGYAVLSRTIDFASRGYAAISMDLPGKGEQRAQHSRSTGPDMDVPTLLRVTPNITYNYLYHAVAAARCAISYLEQQAFVDKTKIGMLGLSWGGVITLIVNGVDQRLAAAVPVFGSGYLDKGSTWQDRFDKWMSDIDKITYNKYFDAKNYLKTQHAPLLYMTGTNDHCYYLPNFIKSYENIPADLVKLAIYPNGRHRFTPEMLQNALQFFDYKLKEKPRSPDLLVGKISVEADSIIIPINYKGPSLAKKICLFYSKSGIARWTIKKWSEIPAYIGNGTYYARIPKEIIAPEILYYTGLKVENGFFISTPIQSLLRFKISDGRTVFASSTPVEEIDYHRISPETWEEITGKKCDIPGDSILLNNLKRLGIKIQNKKYYYRVELP